MASDYAMSAKARSLFSKHITENQFRSMVSLNDVPSIASYLKTDTRYAEVLEGINEKTIHRDVLEQKVRVMAQVEFQKLRHYVKWDRANFYQFYVKRQEIEQILYVLHAIESGVMHRVSYFIDDINTLLSFDVHVLVSQTSFQGLYEFLQTTDYRNLLACLLEDSVSIDQCESILNNYYRKFLQSLIAKEPNKKELQELFNMDDELKAIGYVYRLKYYYNLSADVIAKRVHYTPYLVSHRVMKDWITKHDADGFLGEFYNSSYGKYIEKQDTVNIELLLDSIRYKFFQRTLRFATNTNLTLFAYMYLLRFEITNIIDIIEGVRYKMNADEILKLQIK